MVEFKPDTQSKKIIEQFQNGEPSSQTIYVHGKEGLHPARINMEFEALGDIIVGEYSHSIFCKFIDPEELDRFISIEQEAANSLPKDITFNSMLKEDKLFIKLAVKNDKYNFIFDPPTSPTALDKSYIHQGSILDIDLQPNLWINFEKRTAGLFIKLHSVTVDGGKKKILKRK
jgi:hypothetical protein